MWRSHPLPRGNFCNHMITDHQRSASIEYWGFKFIKTSMVLDERWAMPDRSRTQKEIQTLTNQFDLLAIHRALWDRWELLQSFLEWENDLPWLNWRNTLFRNWIHHTHSSTAKRFPRLRSQDLTGRFRNWDLGRFPHTKSFIWLSQIWLSSNYNATGCVNFTGISQAQQMHRIYFLSRPLGFLRIDLDCYRLRLVSPTPKLLSWTRSFPISTLRWHSSLLNRRRSIRSEVRHNIYISAIDTEACTWNHLRTSPKKTAYIFFVSVGVRNLRFIYFPTF